MPFLYQINADGSQAGSWNVEDKPLVVGRGETVEAFVEDDSLSRSHFLIVPEGPGFFLIDLHSRNGTWINGKKVSAHKLQTNEIIRAGESAFLFSLTPIAPNAFSIPAAFIEQAGPFGLRADAELT